MNAITLREQLHKYIDNADDQRLAVIFGIVNDNNETKPVYDEATIQMLDERRNRRLKGAGQSYSAEESLNFIRQHKR